MRIPWCHLLVFVSLLSAAPTALAQRRPIFLDSAVSGEPDRADEAVSRSRFVRVSLRNLVDGAQAGIVDLNVFPDRSLRTRIERVDRFQTHTVYSGRLDGVEAGEAILVVQNGVLAGTIRGGGKLFNIRFAGAGVYEVQEVDAALLPAEADPLVPSVDHDASASADAAVGAAADDGSFIDVFVAYTPAARAGAGSTPAMQALVNLAVADTNQAYLNSGIIQRVRLVGTAELAYTESGDIGDDLNSFRNPSDGVMDQVHSLRDSSGADLVHLIVETGGSCGIGYVMSDVSTSFASFAFAATRRSCISNLSFAHELGHNMGLQHDRYVNQANSPFPYSHGYVNQAALVPGAPSNKRWRTIMAYNDECAAAGFGCNRLLYFSDPSKVYNGDPMGISGTGSTASPDGPANERASLDVTRTTVANFRTAAAAPPPPSATAPATPTTISPSGDITNTTPTFQWNAVAGASSYKLRVYKGGSGVYTLTLSATVVGCATGSVCSTTPTTTLTAGAHSFRVRAVNAVGSSPWSPTRAFNVVSSGFNSQFNGSIAPWQANSGAWSNMSSKFLYTTGVNGANSSVSYPVDFADLDYRVRIRRYGSGLSDPSRIFIRGNPTLGTLNEWTQGYIFQINQNGLFSVFRNTTALRTWKANAAIKTGSAWNELRVIAKGSSLSFYVNGVLVWSGTDANLKSGKVGIGMQNGTGTTGNQLNVDYAVLSPTAAPPPTSTTTTSVPPTTTTTSVPPTTTTTTVRPTTTTTVRPTTTTTAPANGPDISITKTDSPDPVRLGGSVTYTITVSNHGPGTASSVQFTDIHPASLQFLGSDLGCGPVAATQVMCNLGSMPAGATVSKRIFLKTTATGTLENSATVFSMGDPDMSNNIVRITTQVTN